MRTSWAIAALGIFAFSACKETARDGQQPGDQVKTEQKRAEGDFKRAEDAQKKASNEQQDAKSAQSDVEKARKDLQEKEQKAQKQQSEAQQAQASATTEAQRAQSEGTQAQQRAQQALQQQQASQAQSQQQTAQAEQQSAQTSQQSVSGGGSGTSELTGRLERATASELRLENNAQPLKIDSSTQVTLDGQNTSADQLPPGSEVRASFRQDSGEARAIRIEAKSK